MAQDTNIKSNGPLSDPNRLFQTLLDHISDAVFFKNSESQFIACSQSMVERVGCSTISELLGKTDFDFFTNEHASRAFEDEQRVMRTGKTMANVVEKETFPDGSVKWALTTKSPLKDEFGNIVGVFGSSKDVTELKMAELKLQETHKELLESSRLAGRAEVATGVLHNVGNVLNSMNVSTIFISDRLKDSKSYSIKRLADLVDENKDNLAHFLTEEKQGQQIPSYLQELAEHFVTETSQIAEEIVVLRKNVEHIKTIVNAQQNYAQAQDLVREVNVEEIVEDALQINAAGLARHAVTVEKHYNKTVSIELIVHKALQIIVNLISNAKYAMDKVPAGEPKILSITTELEADCIYISIKDTGIGIDNDTLPKIFEHGFTTRKEGHGFGLHSSAIAANELGGRIEAKSEGLNRGAEFTLILPTSAQRSPE